jgi:hypothetical protein
MPDDEARLKQGFRKSSDAAFEKKLTGQARPNVLFEASRAGVRHQFDRSLISRFAAIGQIAAP